MIYDKRHTFTLAGEHIAYQSGIKDGIVEYLGWKICLRICYDLRFPVWSRNTHNYDLLIYVANWPKPRIQAWDTLLQARAIENLSYVVGVNRIGEDEKEHQYPGHSAIYDALGNSLSGKISSEQKLITAELDYLELQEHRKRLRFLEDQDSFHLY
jgi:predicted amidohydrolase